MRKRQFQDIDEARHDAGFFVREACDYLGISTRTWYRWQAQGYGPRWAWVALDVMAGRLDALNWKGFYIRNGYMYHRDLSTKYYKWVPAHLTAALWCRCPGHALVNSHVRQNGAVDEDAGKAPALSPTAGDSRPQGVHPVTDWHMIRPADRRRAAD